MGTGTQPPRVNIYLSHVTPNAALRNADLSTRRSDGQLVQRPTAALDLHYLLSFYGDEGELVPQRLMGSVVRALHAQPVLTREMIQNTIVSVPYLANSDLANQVEFIKFTPVPLSIEEMSKVWSVFFQTPYALTTAYDASVVLIEDQSTPKTALPARDRGVYVVPFNQPVIERIIREDGPELPIVVGSNLMVIGKRLFAPVTKIRIGGDDVTIPTKDVRDTLIRLQLSSTSLPANVLNALYAGVQGVQVIQPIKMGVPEKEHRGFESNVAAFVLHPRIVSKTVLNVVDTGTAPREADIELKVEPSIRKSQRLMLLMNEVSATAPESYTFFGKLLDPDTVTFHVTKVKKGKYLVRIQVDGAESPLEVSPETDPANPEYGKYVGPEVNIP